MHNTISHDFSADSLQSAELFRLQMDAVAHPGTLLKFPDAETRVEGMNAVAMAIAETLCDHETPVWLDKALRQKPLMDHLRFTCGCPLVESEENASFAFFSGSPDLDVLRAFPTGTPAYPDRSTTVVIQVEALEDDGPVKLSGPGIKTSKALSVAGLKPEFWNWRRENLQKFPLGIDVLLASPTHLVALPRTTVATEFS